VSKQELQGFKLRRTGLKPALEESPIKCVKKKIVNNLPDFYIWFSICSQSYRRMIKVLMVYCKIWLNLSKDDCHLFLNIFPWMIITLPENKNC
jgi:hypothetical protein